MKKIWNMLKKFFNEGDKNIQLGNQNINGNQNRIDNRKIDTSSHINNTTNVYNSEEDKFVHDPVKKIFICFLNCLPVLFVCGLVLVIWSYNIASNWLVAVGFIVISLIPLYFSWKIMIQDKQYIGNKHPHFYVCISIAVIVITLLFNFVFKNTLEKYADDFLQQYIFWQNLKSAISSLVQKLNLTSFNQLLPIIFTIFQYGVALDAVKNCALEQNYIFINKKSSNKKIILPFIGYSLLVFIIYYTVK